MLKYNSDGTLSQETLIHLAQGHISDVKAHLSKVEQFLQELEATLNQISDTAEVEAIRSSAAYQEMQAELKSYSGHG